MIIYLLGHVLFKWITVHALSVVRLGTSAVLLVAGFAVGPVPALGQLIILAVILVVALVIEAVVYADARRQIRRELAHH